jgi:hypothetical protein
MLNGTTKPYYKDVLSYADVFYLFEIVKIIRSYLTAFRSIVSYDPTLTVSKRLNAPLS